MRLVVAPVSPSIGIAGISFPILFLLLFLFLLLLLLLLLFVVVMETVYRSGG